MRSWWEGGPMRRSPMLALRRREFITLVGGAAAWPLAARAQQPKMPVIGLMGSGSAAAQSHLTAAFLQRLRELGWTEGRNLRIEYRWGEGRNERFAEIAAEFVRLKVDLILTHNTPPTLAAKQATSVIPIVFATAGDPVGTGIVASLARPGGNITGLSSQTPDAAGKRLELFQQVVPGLHRLATLADVDNPYADLADKILRGETPAEIPIEQPMDFDLVINLTTAKALGLSMPDKLLALANAVIE